MTAIVTEQFVNNASSTLNGSITNSATSLIVTSASSFPTSGNFRIIVDNEIMLVTAVSTNTFTVTRGYESTTGVSHNSGVPVTHIFTAGALSKAVGMVQLGQQTLGSSVSTVTFSSIPQTYSNLIITVNARSDYSGYAQDCYTQFNGDTGANYSRCYFNANGSTSNTGDNVSTAQPGGFDIVSASATSGFATYGTMCIINYAGSTFVKTATIQQVSPQTLGSGSTGLVLQTNLYLWNNTAAITSVLLGMVSGNFITGSVFTLYGQA
jgi:hypothetical protein